MVGLLGDTPSPALIDQDKLCLEPIGTGNDSRFSRSKLLCQQRLGGWLSRNLLYPGGSLDLRRSDPSSSNSDHFSEHGLRDEHTVIELSEHLQVPRPWKAR